MLKKYHRFFAGITLFLIIVYGILKIWVLRLYAQLLDGVANFIGAANNDFYELVRNQAKQDEFREQTLGWIIYYPTYFLLHIVFIYLLFDNNVRVRNYLMLGLTALICMLVFLWVLFTSIHIPEIGNFFRDQFKNLFGLPFILLAIEGGRILYTDITKLNKK
ncbi:hypothetical protein [Marinoscillum pacificum]|uniref:hypothetical protein n=1 Tax=Marinoscillum pacificum TaxID=392723 RepID=UPI0021576F41|nr:hypothetical protein [Marinoscillum pacificum]